MSDKSTILAEVDMWSKKPRNISVRDVATLYGERPRDERLWCLSPYELITEWEVIMLSHPRSLQDRNHRRHHAELTEVGRAKLKANERYHNDV